MRPLLSLTMIVKDEALSILGVLESCIGAVDHATVMDTGSTDGTQDIIRKFDKFPVMLFDGPFVDFASARNEVLIAEKNWPEASIYCLMLSGDEYLVNPTGLREFLKTGPVKVDAHNINVDINHGEEEMLQTRIIPTDGNWRYYGLVHETPLNVKDKILFPDGCIEGVSINHIVADKERRAASIRGHLPLLEKMLAENPNDVRLMMLLAQTHDYCGMACDSTVPGSAWITHNLAAMGYRMRAAELDPPAPVKSYALLRIAMHCHELGLNDGQAFIKNLDDLRHDYPESSDIALERASNYARFRTVNATITATLQALETIKAGLTKKSVFPTRPQHLWSAYFLLAGCYSILCAKGKTQNSYRHNLLDTIALGIAAGGPKEAFDKLLAG